MECIYTHLDSVDRLLCLLHANLLGGLFGSDQLGRAQVGRWVENTFAEGCFIMRATSCK